jgi:manganese/iron transport system permease protein/iron/zinc/copper transport system permease protein
VASAAQFLVVLVIAPRYGLIADQIRRRRMVPQQLVEDILGILLRAPSDDGRVLVSEITRGIGPSSPRIRRALSVLERQDLVELEGEHATLTAAGRKEGLRLMRAHRLWETYLEHVGTPAGQLHDIAHQLEHVNDEAAVDYLDDKLGHPLRDPHGAEIPADVVHVVPGATIGAAQLREGDHATVQGIGPVARAAGLAQGMEIVAGPRQDNGRLWTFILPGGREIELDHTATDDITVRLAATPGATPQQA